MELTMVDGRPAVVRAGPAALADAALLGRLAGLAVPEVLAVDGDRVTTTWAPPAPSGAVDWVAVARTLADAHDRGVTHGRLDPDALRAGGVVAGWADTGRREDDVAALGGLLPDPVLAARATAADPASRPTMRALATALAASGATPTAAPRNRSVTIRRALRLARRRPAQAGRSGSPHQDTAGQDTPGQDTAGQDTAGPDTADATPPRVEPLPRAATGEHGRPRPRATAAGLAGLAAVLALTATFAARAAEPAPTPTPDPPGGPVPVLAGPNGWWSLGEPGDVAVAADLDCDGTPTPVVLRPRTGTVWALDGWEPDAPAVHLVSSPGATSLVVMARDGCDVVSPRR